VRAGGGHVKLAGRHSWAAPWGLTQFPAVGVLQIAVDFDSDGKKDIWKSGAGSLASAAAQLVGKG